MTPAARDPSPAFDLRQRYGVETPEHVQVHLDLAGLGSRAFAAVMDLLLLTVVGLVLVIVVSGIAGAGALASWITALLVLVGAFLVLGYFTLFEALNGGRTPGKASMGIRVVMSTGRPITPTAAVVRNLLRLIDCFFPLCPFLPAALLMFLQKSNQRLGDMVAGTIVVRDRPTAWTLGTAVGEIADETEPVDAGPPLLSEDEFRLLDRFLQRQSDLDPQVQARLTQELARRFEERIPRRTANRDEYLVQIFAEEQRRRRGRFATRAQTGSAGRTTVTSERFVARKRAAWESFRELAFRVEQAGVGALPEGEIPGFAARYREVAADLARARTYRVDQRVIEYLERVVAAGHSALYRARGRAPSPVGRYLFREFPAAVIESRRYVLAAALLFWVPALTGYALLRARPALADEILPPLMVSRAQQAAEHAARGVGYAQDEITDLPVAAALIIGNNVNVCILAFAGGILFGLLTVWSLSFNGLALGAGFGLFANYHAAGYLGAFVAGHGVLELTAVIFSGAAGLRIAHALIAPGDRTRKDALVVEGMVAARIIGAVVCLLALAGTIEGLFSASDAALPYRIGVSAASGLLLTLYLMNGAKAVRGRRIAPIQRQPASDRLTA